MKRENIQILFQDEYLAVIVKPSGLLSVSYPGSSGATAAQILEQILRKRGQWSRKHSPFAVHRLDKGTSGVMMFALTEKAQKQIMDNWHTMVTSRIYHAVAENPSGRIKPLPDEGVIDKPLLTNAHHLSYVPKNYDLSDSALMPARTNYRILRRGKTYSLFELSLDTGKKNQIRAHLASCGYTLAGDVQYHARTNPLNRLALHARTLAFTHPFTNEELAFENPEPANWEKLVAKGSV